MKILIHSIYILVAPPSSTSLSLLKQQTKFRKRRKKDKFPTLENFPSQLSFFLFKSLHCTYSHNKSRLEQNNQQHKKCYSHLNKQRSCCYAKIFHSISFFGQKFIATNLLKLSNCWFRVILTSTMFHSVHSSFV